jgi:hypothetical protein
MSEVLVRRLLDLALTVVVSAGLPISQLAIKRLRWPGAAAVTAVSAGILVADLANLATNRSTGTIRRAVRLEAATAGAATVAGARLLLDPGVESALAEGWQVRRSEMLRRLALGLLFGILSARVRSQAASAGQAPGTSDSQA